jgi:hypothetical protein
VISTIALETKVDRGCDNFGDSGGAPIETLIPRGFQFKNWQIRILRSGRSMVSLEGSCAGMVSPFRFLR